MEIWTIHSTTLLALENAENVDEKIIKAYLRKLDVDLMTNSDDWSIRPIGL